MIRPQLPRSKQRSVSSLIRTACLYGGKRKLWAKVYRQAWHLNIWNTYSRHAIGPKLARAKPSAYQPGVRPRLRLPEKSPLPSKTLINVVPIRSEVVRSRESGTSLGPDRPTTAPKIFLSAPVRFSKKPPTETNCADEVTSKRWNGKRKLFTTSPVVRGEPVAVSNKGVALVDWHTPTAAARR